MQFKGDAGMTESEENGRILERVEQIYNKVSEIDTKLERHTNEIGDIKIEIALLKQQNSDQQNTIQSMKSESNKLKWQIIGCMTSIIAGIALAIIRLGLSL